MKQRPPDPKDLLRDAQAASVRHSLADYREAIASLREKRFTWRQIADFLRERGVVADHTAVYRFMKKEPNVSTTVTIPPAAEYAAALVALNLAPHEKAMLRAHYLAPNRTITYTQLADSVGYKNYGGANLHYGYLGRKLGEKLGMTFYGDEEIDTFFSSAIGMGNPYGGEGAHFQLVMHHELAKAIDQLGWFKE